MCSVGHEADSSWLDQVRRRSENQTTHLSVEQIHQLNPHRRHRSQPTSRHFEGQLDPAGSNAWTPYCTSNHRNRGTAGRTVVQQTLDAMPHPETTRTLL